MTNLGGLIAFLKQYSPHLVAVQETIHNTEELSLLVKRFQYTAFVSKSQDQQPGIAFIYQDILPVKDIHVLQPGRLLQIYIEDGPSFVNVYAPSGSQGRAARRILFSDTLFRNLSNKANLPYLIGDFNCVINRQDTVENFNNKNCPALSDLVNTFSYSDGFRLLSPQAIEFTFSSPGAFPSRLDRVYVPASSTGLVRQVSHHATLSDHRMLTLRVEWAPPAPLPRFFSPYWKLNVSILSDEDFKPNFERLWSLLVAKIGTYPSLPAWWEGCFKPEAMKFLKRFSKMKAVCKRDTKNFLFFCLEKAIEDEDWEEVAAVRGRIGNFLREDLYGYKLRSRDSSHAEDERGSLYHVAREARHGRAGSLLALCRGESVTRDSEEIENSIVDFFTALFNGQHRTVPGSDEPIDTGVGFTPDRSREGEFLSDRLGKVKPELFDSLLKEFTVEELKLALKSCARERSPGLDGLPYEFYQSVQNIIGPTLLQVYHDQLDQQLLLPSFRKGVTRLLNKVEPQIPQVNQLRPITLLSCDYKIMTKLITARLNKVLPSVITSGQLCSKKNQNILFGASNLVSSLLSFQQSSDSSGFIVSFDIFKAYDKTSIEFIVKVMKQMQFPDKFIGWIETVHRDASTMFILQNLSREVKVRLSVRQGDPLAMPCFLLNIEPLVVRIGTMITGAPVAGLQQRDEDYVDDITCVSSSLHDLSILDNLFMDFENLSGTVLNRSRKSKIMGLGAWAERTDWPLTWLQSVKSLKIFGFHFHQTLEETSVSTWKAVSAGFRNCLSSWKARDLPTLSSRVFVLKIFALSKLWYVAQVLPLPASTARVVKALMGQFVWRGRLERLALDEIHSPPDKGGLGLPCLEARCEALLLTHTCRMLAVHSSSRRHLAYWMGLSLRNLLPDLARGPNAELVPNIFKKIVNVFKHCAGESIFIENLSSVKCKVVYSDLTNSLPPPKIENKINRKWERVWKRVASKWLPTMQCDALFVVLHDIYPTNYRLFRMNLHPTGFCDQCREDDTVVHKFSNCYLSSTLWLFVKNLIETMTDKVFDILSLFYLDFDKTNSDKEIIFTISFVYNFVINCLKNNETPSLREFVGSLRHAVMKNSIVIRLNTYL